MLQKEKLHLEVCGGKILLSFDIKTCHYFSMFFHVLGQHPIMPRKHRSTTINVWWLLPTQPPRQGIRKKLGAEIIDWQRAKVAATAAQGPAQQAEAPQATAAPPAPHVGY